MAEAVTQQPAAAPDSGSAAESHINDMDFILGESPDAGNEDQTTDTPEDDAEATDSGEPSETPVEEGTESTEEPVAAADKESRILELAKEYGLDPKTQRKALDVLYAQEKRIRDKDSYIENLSSDAWMTDFERELLKSQGQPTDQKPAQTQAPIQRPQGDKPVYKNAKYGWTEPKDAAASLYDAFVAQDMNKASDIQEEWFAEQLHGALPSVLNVVNGLVAARLAEFRSKDLGEIIPSFQANKMSQIRQKAYDQAENDLTASPEMKKLWQEMNTKTSEKEVEWKGVKSADTPLNKIFMEYPEIFDIRKEHPDPATAFRLTAVAQYRAAMRVYAQRKGAVITPKKAEALVKAGAEQANRENGKDRARQKLTAGGARGGQATPSTDDDWLKEITKNRGSSSGISAQKLF